MKQKIAIMLTGQIRTNGLSKLSNDTTILDSIRQNLLNDIFKDHYDYDIFISTDQIDINKTIEYFGINLKNINITEENWYYNPILTEVESYEYFYNKYLDTIQKMHEYRSHIESFYQNYRIYCGYKMIIDNEQKTNTNYDYYIKIRLDSRIMQDFTQIMLLINKNHKKICMEHDHIIIVNKDYKDIFKFINFIGIYQNKIDNSEGIFNYFFRGYFEIDPNDLTLFFCPERQIIEYIKQLTSINKENIKDVFMCITYPSFHLIYRGNDSYAYSDYNSQNIFQPFNTIDFLKTKF